MLTLNLVFQCLTGREEVCFVMEKGDVTCSPMGSGVWPEGNMHMPTKHQIRIRIDSPVFSDEI